MQVPLVIGEVRHDRALHSHVPSDHHGECIPIREKAYDMTVSESVLFSDLTLDATSLYVAL